MKNNKLTSTWNYAEGWIESQWQDFIKPAYLLLEQKRYEEARLKILSIINSTKYYQEKTNTDIKQNLSDMNAIVSPEYREAKRNNKDVATYKEKSVQSMYDILSKINYMFASLSCFVGVVKKDPIKDSTRMG